MNWLKKLFRSKKDKALLPTHKMFVKHIYSWRKKSPNQLYEILEIEVQHLLKVHPQYKLKGFSKPLYSSMGGMFYKIFFKLK